MEYTLRTVCLIANDIINRVPNLYLPNKSLIDTPFNYFLKEPNLLFDLAVKSVQEGPQGNPESIVKHIEHNKLDLNIVGGYAEFLEKKPPEYLIVINGRHNNCWKRFALIKEVCSLYVNHYAREKGHHLRLKVTGDYLDSLYKSYSQKSCYNDGKLENSDLDSDTFAILLASELMIPPRHRSYTDTLKTRMQAGEIKLNDIAKSLLIPEHILKIHFDFYYNETSELYKLLTLSQASN